MATQSFTPLDTRQQALCKSVGIEEPQELSLIRETDTSITMRHHKSGNEVWIEKGEAQKRKERMEYGLWL